MALQFDELNNYTHSYMEYNPVMYKIMDETISLRNLKDRLIDDGVATAEIKKHSTSIAQLAEYAHQTGNYYFITIFKNEIPHCFIVNDDTGVTVQFLDERLFWYISMTYMKKTAGQMFLSEIWVREYMHKEDKMLRDLKSDQHFQFSEEGKLWITKETIIREDTVKIQREEREASELVNVSQNWQKIPAFGDYNYLVDYQKIIKPGDLSKY